jgi:uncharacterized protein (DUF983 family)
MSQPPSRSTAILRGLKHRCPNCGVGRLYGRYLKVEPACRVCGHDLGQYRADDGPSYFTILLVGHLVIGPLLFFPWIWRAPAAVVVPATLIPLLILTLVLLPRVKGALIGLLYSLHTHGEHPPETELAASETKAKPLP